MFHLNKLINRDTLLLSIICATVTAVLYTALSFFFSIDDFDYLGSMFFSTNRFTLNELSRFTSEMCMRTHMFRPLQALFFFEYHVFGFISRGYNIFLLIQTLLLCMIIYYMVKRLTNNTTVGFFSALLYGIHPLHIDMFSLGNNTQTLATIFSCLAFLCFDRFVHTAKRTNLYSSLFLCLLAFMGWQLALGLPFALIVYLLLFGKAVARNKKYEAIGSLLLIFFSYSLLLHVKQKVTYCSFSLTQLHENFNYAFLTALGPFTYLLEKACNVGHRMFHSPGFCNWYGNPWTGKWVEKTIDAAALGLIPLIAFLVLHRGKKAVAVTLFIISWPLITVIPLLFFSGWYLYPWPHHLAIYMLWWYVLPIWAITALIARVKKSHLYFGKILYSVFLFFTCVYSIASARAAWDPRTNSHRWQGDTVRTLTVEIKKIHPSFPDGAQIYLVNFPWTRYAGIQDLLRFYVCIPMYFNNKTLKIKFITADEFAVFPEARKTEKNTYIFIYREKEGVYEINV